MLIKHEVLMVDYSFQSRLHQKPSPHTLAVLTFLLLAAWSRTQLNRGLHLTQLQITIKGGEYEIQRRE